MKHADLVERAARWLRNTIGCSVVLTEFVSYAREIPDAIGWKSHESILVECKTSRSDFLVDARKITRKMPKYCMGDWRFYLAPSGIIKPEELPDGWGLYEVHHRSVRYVAGLKYSNARRKPNVGCLEEERIVLVSALRRAVDMRWEPKGFVTETDQ